VADSIYNQLLSRGIDVLIDDRDERPGVMLADLELIGIPHRVVIGERSLKEGNVEYQQRRDAEPRMVKVAEVVDQLAVKLRPLET
jgi:prolyl-tRNA synthetase